MKLETNGRIILDVTRAKAKQYEFGIDEQYHITLPQDPKRLLVFTIGVLGELGALESRPNDERDEARSHLKDQLVLAGQYFESMSTARLITGSDEYLRILSSASYYLADMPGSSLVLARTISEVPEELTASGLERLLVWLLKSDISNNFQLVPLGVFNDLVRRVARVYRSFINFEADLSDVNEELIDFRAAVYLGGSDREILLVDTITALVKRKIDNSSLVCLPRYTALSLDRWKQTLASDRFLKEFWPGQRLVGELGVLTGSSAVIQMPTSAGKTKSAELIIRSAFLSGRAKLAVVVAPFRALCREITQGFSQSFENDFINVNELRDITNIDDDEQEFLRFLLGDAYKGAHDHTVIVSTPEKLVYLLRHEPSLAERIGLLIFDEGHQFDSGKRGITYELLIASLKESVSDSAQKVLISAVMSNAETIGEWLNGESGVHIQGSNSLPSLKSVAFLSWVTEMGQLSYLGSDNKNDSGLYVPKVIQQLNLGRKGRERNDRLFPVKGETQSISCYLGLKLCHQGPVAIFCGDKRSVVSLCKTIVNAYDRNLPLSKPSAISDSNELERIAFLSNLHFSDSHIFSKAIPLGVLPHSSSVPNGIRMSVEWAMDKKSAHFVVCTSTLAQGVNLPIKYLLVSTVMQGGKWISIREFQNLIGRAGRSGYHTEGGIIFTDPQIYDGRYSWKGQFKWRNTLKLLDFNNAEACLSSLVDIIKPFSLEQASNDLIEFIRNPTRRRAEWKRWGDESGVDVTVLMSEMDSKELVLYAVESYFLSMLKDDESLLEISSFLDLARDTLAYHLASEGDRKRLLEVFSIIHFRLSSVPVEKFSFYGRTLLGLDQLRFIEDWIDANQWDLELCSSSNELLDACWELISEFSVSKIIANIQPQMQAVELAKRWCNGTSYHDLLSYAKENKVKVQAKSKTHVITQEHIVDFCTAISYDGMMLVGGLADIVEGKSLSDEILGNARALQNQLKLGLSEEFHIWLYSKGYSDREVCKYVAAALGKVMSGRDVVDYNVLKDNKELLSEALSRLPRVFSEVKAR